MEIVKIGPVELLEEEARKMYSENKYIVTYTKIYQIHFSQAQNRFYGSCIYTYDRKGGPGMTRRGRFYALPASEVNRLVGCPLVREENHPENVA